MVEIKRNKLKAGVKGQDPIINVRILLAQATLILWCFYVASSQASTLPLTLQI